MTAPKSFTLLVFSMLTIAAMAATNYGINVGGVEVSSSNYSNVTGGAISGGKVVYDNSSKTLTLTDVTIERSGGNDRAIHNRSCDNLTIVIKGTCEFTCSGCSTLKFERSTTLKVPSGNTCKVTCTSSGDDAIWVTHDKNTELVITGSGNIYLDSTKGDGIAGSKNESVEISARNLYIDANHGAFSDLATVNFEPSSDVITAGGVTYSMMVNIKPTGSSSYAHAHNVSSITAGSNVTVKRPSFGSSVTILSTSSNYSKSFIISDEVKASGYYSAHNFLFSNTATTYDGEYLAVLAGPSLELKYSYPSSIEVPGFLYLSGAYRPVKIGVGAFRDMEGLTTARLLYGVTYIGDNAFIYDSNLTTVYIPSSVKKIDQSVFYYSGLSRIFWSTLDPTSVTMSSYSFDTGYNYGGVVYLPTDDAKVKASSTAISGKFTPKVNSDGAYDFASGSARYVVTKRATNSTFDGEMALTGYNGAALSINSSNGQYTHPTSSSGNGGGYTCVSVPPTAFKDNTTLTSVNLGYSGIKTIGKDAFSGASGIKSLTIGEGVTYIGTDAFQYCTAIQTGVWNAVNCHDFTTSNHSPFYYAQNAITSVTFGSNVKSIPAYLCWGCAKIKSLSIPSSVTYIGDRAYGASGLTSLTIPNTVQGLGEYAFNSCPLTSLTIGTGLTSLSEGVFSSTDMTSVTIPNTITEIGKSAFSSCQKLTSVNIGTGVKTIGETAFSSCISLRSLTFPDNVSRIGDKAFYYCKNLETVTAGKEMRYIGTDAFNSCTSLKTINWNATNAMLSDFTSSLFSSSASSITAVNFGDDIEYSPNYLCSGFTSLKTVTVPSKVKWIGTQALSSSSLTRINALPREASWITMGSEVFSRVNKQTCELHVNWGSLSSYKKAAQWKDFFNIIDDIDAPGYNKFDVNGDKKVDVGDVNAVLDAILNNSNDSKFDVNGDNKVDVGDVNAILDYILNH